MSNENLGMRTIQGPNGSGTSEYAIAISQGHLYSRGYGERHGWTFGGTPVCRYSVGEWRLVDDYDWRTIPFDGVDLSIYEDARIRMELPHAEALDRARRWGREGAP